MADRKIPKLRAARLTPPERLDVALVDRLAPFLMSPAGQRLGRVGNLGDKPPLLALSATVLLRGLSTRDRRCARAGARMLAAHLLSIAAVQWGKNRIDRSRPRRLIADRGYLFARGRSPKQGLRAFPSGHTAGSVALAAAYQVEFSGAAPAVAAAAGTMGALQVVRRAHWPTDVLAGAAVGLAAAALASWLIRPARPCQAVAKI